MAHYNFSHPWDANFAIPKYVLAEPQGRGTFTTKYTPRGTISVPPQNRQIYNQTRWATPDYAQGLYDQTARTTKWLPRRTVDILAPDFFSRPPATAPVATGSTLDGSTLAKNTLGTHAVPAPAIKGDPIVFYGKKGADIILWEISKLPRDQRKRELENVFDSLGFGFRTDVEKKTAAYRAKGNKADVALHKAIAATLSNKMLEDFIKVGQGKLSATSGFSPASGLLSSIGDALGDLHCFVATSGITKAAATVAGTVYGGPAGGAAAGTGAQLMAAPCGGGGGKAVVAPLLPPPFIPVQTFPILPIAVVAGGALILILALKA